MSESIDAESMKSAHAQDDLTDEQRRELAADLLKAGIAQAGIAQGSGKPPTKLLFRIEVEGGNPTGVEEKALAEARIFFGDRANLEIVEGEVRPGTGQGRFRADVVIGVVGRSRGD
ncbi:hypothetical protein [Nonomuraea sp. NPDC050643]|uniref:hypothetical protein n=1 Tax=Nonomuraea sp. NPDC050643 TaxID=3155660 RepID=UPI0033C9383C